METDLARQLESLFHEVGEAHHQAYIERTVPTLNGRCGTQTIYGKGSEGSSTPASSRVSSSTCWS
jgi:hypothetical protein